MGSTLMHDAADHVEMEEVVVAQTRNALNSIKDTLAQVNCTVNIPSGVYSFFVFTAFSFHVQLSFFFFVFFHSLSPVSVSLFLKSEYLQTCLTY